MRQRRPTLEQVARHAGVSRATVSRVVNGSPTVAAEIQEQVAQSVRALGYVPNHAARSLVTQRANSFALVLPEPSTRVFSEDQFFPALIRGISQELEPTEIQLVLMMATSPASHARITQYVLAGHVDGAMVASMHGADPLPMALSDTGVPVVVNGRPLAHCRVPYVDVDSTGGAERAVRHLIDRGRRHIATIAGPQDMVAGIDRLAGYHLGIDGTGQRPIVAPGDFTRESGETAMRHLLETHPAVDAVFAASDLMAHGAIRALRGAGRRVPDDVAVVGFDDVDLARYVDPQLTTVRQPIGDIGRAMVRQLVTMAAGGEVEPAVILPTTLVLRESA
ncbi:MAG: LacI family DNA-binding transcriptional regulator [Dactylosporangium sp.]|nr:LacI family transcriptional regulator [Dactylosporangium sp.]NNJ62281.1 LacI family DNA-binding transcriptional regulator [Dactylosporangium sp.]